VCVLPVVDTRDAATLPPAERGLPIRYGNDDFWERPVPEMLGEVLVRQLQDGALFTQVRTGRMPRRCWSSRPCSVWRTGRSRR
jgi:hypothetical protein